MEGDLPLPAQAFSFVVHATNCGRISATPAYNIIRNSGSSGGIKIARWDTTRHRFELKRGFAMEQSTTGDMVLASQSIVRVLIITGKPDQSPETAEGIYTLLRASSHQVSVTGMDSWRDSLSVNAPEIVLLDSPANMEAAG